MPENLFSRLSKYTPRQGEQRVRKPLEDFCTEALAYFLVSSNSFRKRFVDEVLELPQVDADDLGIHTQHTSSFHKGRADLVLLSRSQPNERIGIEVKIGAGFQEGQLDNMEAGFKHAFLLAPLLYFDRKASEISQSNLKRIPWERVQCLLAEMSVSDDSLNLLFQQFSEFLCLHGYQYFTMKTKIPNSPDFIDFIDLLDEWTKFLPQLRDILDLGTGSLQWDAPNHHNEGSSFYGIYGSDEKYAGFELTAKGRVNCFYQRNFPDPRPELIVPSEGDFCRLGNNIWIAKRAPYPVDEGDVRAILPGVFEQLVAETAVSLENWRTTGKH